MQLNWSCVLAFLDSKARFVYITRFENLKKVYITRYIHCLKVCLLVITHLSFLTLEQEETVTTASLRADKQVKQEMASLKSTWIKSTLLLCAEMVNDPV